MVLLAAAPAGRGRIVDATSVLPALAAVPPGVLAGTEVATVVELADPVEPQTVLTRLRAAATAAGAGRLAVYLAGQVHMDQRQGLPHLALARTSTATLRYTALPWHWLADALKERRPGITTVVADLVADADAWRALEKRPELLELPLGASLFGRVAPPPARRAGPATPDYLRAYATIWRAGERPTFPSLHAQAVARTAADPVVLLSQACEPPQPDGPVWQLRQQERVLAAEVAADVAEEFPLPLPQSLSPSDDADVSEARQEEPDVRMPAPVSVEAQESSPEEESATTPVVPEPPAVPPVAATGGRTVPEPEPSEPPTVQPAAVPEARETVADVGQVAPEARAVPPAVVTGGQAVAGAQPSEPPAVPFAAVPETRAAAGQVPESEPSVQPAVVPDAREGGPGVGQVAPEPPAVPPTVPPVVRPAAVPEARVAASDAGGGGAPRVGDAARGAWGKVRAVARGWRGGAEAVEPEAPVAVVVAPGQGDPHPGILAADRKSVV